jgi:hypothetical protein
MVLRRRVPRVPGTPGFRGHHTEFPGSHGIDGVPGTPYRIPWVPWVPGFRGHHTGGSRGFRGHHTEFPGSHGVVPGTPYRIPWVPRRRRGSSPNHVRPFGDADWPFCLLPATLYPTPTLRVSCPPMQASRHSICPRLDRYPHILRASESKYSDKLPDHDRLAAGLARAGRDHRDRTGWPPRRKSRQIGRSLPAASLARPAACSHFPG